jgi:hypothetical protein
MERDFFDSKAPEQVVPTPVVEPGKYSFKSKVYLLPHPQDAVIGANDTLLIRVTIRYLQPGVPYSHIKAPFGSKGYEGKRVGSKR